MVYSILLSKYLNGLYQMIPFCIAMYYGDISILFSKYLNGLYQMIPSCLAMYYGDISILFSKYLNGQFSSGGHSEHQRGSSLVISSGSLSTQLLQ